MKKTLSLRPMLLTVCSILIGQFVFAQDREGWQADGSFGVGTSSPKKLFQVHNNRTEDNNILVSGRSASIWFTELPTLPKNYSYPFGRIGLASRTAAFLLTAQSGDFVIHNVTTGGNILFGTGMDDAGTNGVERMRLSAKGNLGINVTSPTAKLHVYGDVRFQGLPTRPGTVLVLDENGYVCKSNSLVAVPVNTANDVASLEAEVKELKKELEELRAQMAALRTATMPVASNND
ncbi:hypothetical protein [Chitinophaga silvisoli]|nr:hypothetical protein [Chitinophaga silvisoli]